MPNKNSSGGTRDPAPDGEPTGRAIYIRAVVDVAGLLRAYPDALRDGETPTAVGFDKGHMIVTATSGAGVADQDTATIDVDADPGDTLHFFAKSGSNNFEHAALIKEVRAAGPDETEESAAPVSLLRSAIHPASKSGASSQQVVDREFWFWRSPVTGKQTQRYSLLLALYDRDDHGQPRFAGLYRWELNLTAH